MPLISDDPIDDMSDDMARQIPEWLFEHGRLGYQRVRGELFIYRLPTLRECLLYHKASAHHSVNAGKALLTRIGKSPLPRRTRPQDVAMLITDILDEAFPANDKEDKLLEDIKLEKASYGLLLAKALEPHVKYLDMEKSVWSMSYPEVIEALALKELITGESIEGKKKQRGPRQAHRRPQRRHPGKPREVRGGPGESDNTSAGREAGRGRGQEAGTKA